MIKKITPFLKNYLPLLFIITLSGVLRFFSLGYSDYQGDEIKSLFIKEEDMSYSEFFLDQRKGPGQFFVTFITKQLDQDYSNEFLHRFPFAIAGFFSVYFFYKLVLIYFNKKIAFYSAFFMMTNGFFVAFSRIVQYQSFTILFMIASLYYFSLSVINKKNIYRNFFVGFILWSFSMLFHYDGVFILPFTSYLIFLLIRNNIYKKGNYETKKVLFLSLFISGVFLLSFYLPFIINISKNTLEYWSGRVSGDVSGKVASSMYLFSVYQPIYIIHFYLMLFILGIFHGLSTFIKRYIIRFKKLDRFIPEFNFKPRYFLLFTAWMLLPLIFMEIFIYIPGTHIYTYLIPLFVIISLGINFIEIFLSSFKKFFIPGVIFYFGLFILFLFLYLQSYSIYVDNTSEYPWEEEKFLIWNFPRPNPIYHISIFGFPYYRNWEGIRDAILTTNNNTYYSSNERVSITRYYIPFEKDTDKAGYYIHILAPQSFTDKIYQDKALYWSERYRPIFTFSRNGKDLVRVYFMEKGTLNELKIKGF
ncbi:hypothetical protein A2V49_01935 [candidate division WWE3 bacterium RBG_19FT_COMBO_34_6]|uniref:Glycosyltransferase RgtA/B/C/D-like domain-containing protein n=1 Tax=candidate division WWE3 bacterium RBG_19FT_COMBO_34_6 TaxID=1802612 RepID=A0A1F4UM51_UNCKA|nr:MAG: hypothetical protein A2V49_01935 [candidate division WWE3 bacterium RBG_19FT_COMBO_34_6]